MLEKPIMFTFMLFLLLFFLASSLILVGGVAKWYQLSAQTHILANTMSRHGYYNQTCKESLTEFCKRSNIKENELTVITNSDSPNNMKTYGETVSVKINYPYKKKLIVGSMHSLFNWEIKTEALAVSTCVPGLHVSP